MLPIAKVPEHYSKNMSDKEIGGSSHLGRDDDETDGATGAGAGAGSRTRGQKVGGHFKKWWWLYLLILICIIVLVVCLV
jgi:hypothetical protein